ncbi:MAG TPA: co-chaperone GroES, partial [Planctomycetota bacterium]|nr:co-chaperone GroES [Planctomycetota bacterium]
RTIKPAVSVGDIVLYSKYAGSEVKVDGKELKIVQESEILAIIG